jgi:hypothetical protein
MFPIVRPATNGYSRVHRSGFPEGNMENRWNAFAETSPQIDGILSRPRSANSDPAPRRLPVEALSSCQVAWTILRTSSVNGLIVGSLHLNAGALAWIDSNLQQPVVWWDPTQTPDPPELAAGTLVIREVDRLEAGQQERLSRWLCRHRPALQVLALARTPLFEQVLDARFSPELYYRMNTVTIEVRGLADLPGIG